MLQLELARQPRRSHRYLQISFSSAKEPLCLLVSVMLSVEACCLH